MHKDEKRQSLDKNEGEAKKKDIKFVFFPIFTFFPLL